MADIGSLGKLAISLEANIAKFESDLGRASRFAEGAMAKISRSAEIAKFSLGSIGVGLSVSGFAAFIKNAVDAQDHLNDLSKTTTLSVENLSGLALAAKQSGGDLDGTAAAINKLAVNMGKNA